MVGEVARKNAQDIDAAADTSDAVWEAKAKGDSIAKIKALCKKHCQAAEKAGKSLMSLDRTGSAISVQNSIIGGWCMEAVEIPGVGIGGTADGSIGEIFGELSFEKYELLARIREAGSDRRPLGLRLRQINLELRRLRRLAQGLR